MGTQKDTHILVQSQWPPSVVGTQKDTHILVQSQWPPSVVGTQKSTQDIGAYCAFADDAGTQKDTFVVSSVVDVGSHRYSKRYQCPICKLSDHRLLRVLKKTPKMLGCTMFYWQRGYSKRYPHFTRKTVANIYCGYSKKYPCFHPPLCHYHLS